jgi:hypothetical protein
MMMIFITRTPSNGFRAQRGVTLLIASCALNCEFTKFEAHARGIAAPRAPARPLSQPNPRAAAVLVDEQLLKARECAGRPEDASLKLLASRTTWFAKSHTLAGSIFFNEIDSASLKRSSNFFRGLFSSTQFPIGRLEPSDRRFRDPRMSRQVRLGPAEQRAGRFDLSNADHGNKSRLIEFLLTRSGRINRISIIERCLT